MGGTKSFSRMSARPARGLRAGAGTTRRPAAVATIVACVGALGLTAACGNTDAICADTRKTLEGFAAKTQTLPPDGTAQWKQAISEVAGHLDVLARRADDEKLKRTLGDTAASYRAAATGMDHGDTAALSTVIHDQPQRLAAVCR